MNDKEKRKTLYVLGSGEENSNNYKLLMRLITACRQKGMSPMVEIESAGHMAKTLGISVHETDYDEMMTIYERLCEPVFVNEKVYTKEEKEKILRERGWEQWINDDTWIKSEWREQRLPYDRMATSFEWAWGTIKKHNIVIAGTEIKTGVEPLNKTKNMNTYNKEFIYRGYTFNIKVELNTRTEKRLNGKRWHTVTINDMGPSNFYIQNEILSEVLEERIKMLIHETKCEVDAKLRKQISTDEQILINLGFKS